MRNSMSASITVFNNSDMPKVTKLEGSKTEILKVVDEKLKENFTSITLSIYDKK